MRMSPRESMLTWTTAVVFLFVGSYVFCKPYIASRKTQQDVIAMLDKRISEARQDLSHKDVWEGRLAELQKAVQPLPSDRTADNHLKRAISELAAAVDGIADHRVRLSDKRQLEEETHGGLHVLPLACGMSEANTKGLVRLLLDLQTNSAIFDVRELSLQSSGKDKLSGNFTVNCIYTKQEENNQ